MKTNSSARVNFKIILTMTAFCVHMIHVGTTAAAVDQLNSPDAYVVITRYDIQESTKEKIAKALNTYVLHAVANEDNIMAEVFQEQEQPLVLWVVERWKTKDEFKDFFQSTNVKKMLQLSKTELLRPTTTYYLKDLAPLSKSDWRNAPTKNDKPIVIMLFVNSKPGTEDTFTKLYDAAMPKFRSEPGVIAYGLSQFEDDRTQFVTYEKFRNEDAFKYHLNFPPIQPVLDYLNTSIKAQPFQRGLHRLVPLAPTK